ncbi:hypothetical protein GCM10023347_51790 [Streptomyces chumphonensis]|uniref:DUF397 domain-containing protein n=1 Tax=Streptomyces chumphonensis TaxID=1214925 RepID=A0A927IF37_9ACTN|nr:DUF397 domain-containing protein [Streptomyces chumphonensis]MBD3934530.1 DUF397 domain-containing protein [Streptomyces chumphonensis]
MRTDRNLSAVEWVKSSYSTSDGGNCVEWAPAHAAALGVVAVRDSKEPRRTALRVSPAGWAGFVAAVRDGDLGTA